MGKVLVLGDDTRSFLSVIRSLGRSGLQIQVVATPSNSPSLRSRYVHHIHRLPAFRRDNAEWLRALVRLLEAERFDLVIPCHDFGLLLLQAHRAELEDLPGIYLAGQEAFEVCFSRARTCELAERLAIRVPRHRIARNEAELEAAADAFGFPLVLQPHAPIGPENPSGRRMVRKMWRREDLAEARGGQEVLVQEDFTGTGVGVEALCREGEILTAFQHQRVHEPLMEGGGSYRTSMPLDPELLEATQKLTSALRYTGAAMVEFKVDSRSRAWTLIEIGGRFSGSLPLAIAAGIDFPRYLYEMLVLGRTEFPRHYHYGERSALRKSSETLAWADPAPAFAEVAQHWRYRVWPRVELLWRSRSQLKRRASHAMGDAQHVLFICKGNICRSPFAEEALRASGFSGICSSRGFLPLGGQSSPPEAIEAAARLGIDLRSHRSRVLDDAAIEAADTILIFDNEHLDALAASYPAALKRTHFFGALDDGGPLQIADPYGQGAKEFDEIYSRIFRLARDVRFLRSLILNIP